MAAKTWPTPTTRDHKGGGTALIRSDGKLRNDMLDWVAENWATPRVEMARSLGNPKYLTPDRGGGNLEDQAAQWKTPAATDTGVNRQTMSRGDLLLTGQALQLASLTSILPDRPISTDGNGSSHIRRTLNPLFVEWLMGWPRGWTSLALTPPASIGSACSATALSAWKRRMRSALWSLDLPLEAPPAQLSLLDALGV